MADLDALDAAERVSFVGNAKAVAPLSGSLTLALTGAVAALRGRKVTLPNLQLHAGEALALTGPSGAGKSTAIAAIAGLVPLAEGRITVCGVALDGSTADAWRARIALIPQVPHFPDQTLRDWLAPAGPSADPCADPWPALQLAEADGVVQRLPSGLDTRLGESGGGVSGGEARRLMIARAILSGRELILADEPTADLDPETAAQVIRALVRLKDNGHSLIVATHDSSLAEAMDRSIEMPT
ncbi:ATP-binding cassette domain-containing protein [Aquicoccus sp. G2-2]|uniref:ATP-binding cassette domain-containing protein n=1 Tax=Aquicoccus sp. G2-2 TaxID=3092120 RepID=UPI002AE006D6|nr:ATP-binding cassette domain-containing protein [Aquicoccus sp. G2-2]MEA1114758.1 ATP-binding cassette domain-containing protein [Aquicoccus sp. G2-2]